MPERNKNKQTDKAKVQPKPVPNRRRNKRLPYIVASVVTAAVVVLVSIAVYQQYIAPFQQTIMTIDGKVVVKMRYFLERARLSGSGGLATISALNNEEILKLAEIKYGISVTEEDIDTRLRSDAVSGENVTMSDVEFNEWYRQLINERKVSSNLYRQQIAAQIREAKFREYLYGNISSTRAHAHTYAIFIDTYDNALALKDRIDNGENFQALAKEVSLDETTGDLGGELDWIPRGVYVFNMDPFSLEIGKVSDVLAVMDESSSSSSQNEPSVYYLMMVTEQEDRETLSSYLSEVQEYEYQQWLSSETTSHTIKWNYNSEIDSWVSWQLSKSNPSTTTAAGG